MPNVCAFNLQAAAYALLRDVWTCVRSLSRIDIPMLQRLEPWHRYDVKI